MNKFWIVILLTFMAFGSFAQGKYKFHTVKQGETKYGISKEYSISIEELERFNPDIKDGLREGMNLLIPKTGQTVEGLKDDTPKAAPQKVTHTVKAGETVYSLSNTYGISILELNQANPQLKDGLKTGMELVIPNPKNKVESIAETMSIPPDNPDYKYHKVLPGETAYSLSKEYNIGLDSLYLYNPTAEDGLLIGQVLKFPKKKNYNVAGYGYPKEGLNNDEKSKPVKPDTTQVTVINSPAEDDTTKGKPVLLYKVKDGDTFYSLKRKFKVERDELKEYNPEMGDTLKEGKYIILPKKENSEAVIFLDQLFDKIRDDKDPKKRDLEYAEEHYGQFARVIFAEPKEKKVDLKNVKPDFDKEYLVGVMLPFFASAGDSLTDVEKRSVFALDFYNGFWMAADSLSRAGMKLNLKVMDTKNSMFKLKEQRYKIENTPYDMVVGPLYKENVEYVAGVLQKNNVPVISPLSKSVNVSGHPNLIQAVPADEGYAGAIAQYLNKNFNMGKVIFAHTGSVEDRAKVTQIKSMLNARRDNDFVSSIIATDGQVSFSDLRVKIGAIGENVIVLISENEVFSTDIINKLRRLNNATVHVVAPSKIMDNPALAASDLNRLHLVMPDMNYTSYSNSKTKHFILEYRKKYHAEPSRFAHQGYDVGVYFLENLYKYGPYFYSAISTFESEATAMGFKMEKQTNGGYLNEKVYITGLKSMELVRIL